MAIKSSLIQDVATRPCLPSVLADMVDQYATGTHSVALSKNGVIKTIEAANFSMFTCFKTVELSTFDYLVRTFFMVITLGISRAVLNDQFRTAVFAGNFQYAANVIKLGAAGDVSIEDLRDLANEGNTDALEFLFAQNTVVYATPCEENHHFFPNCIFTRICNAVEAAQNPDQTYRLSMQGAIVALRTLLKYSHQDFRYKFDAYNGALFQAILDAKAYELADTILDYYPELKDDPRYLRQRCNGRPHDLSRWQYVKGKQAPTSKLLEEARLTGNPEIFAWALKFSATHSKSVTQSS